LYFFGGVASFPVRKHLAESFVSYQINYQDDAMMCFHTGFTLNGTNGSDPGSSQMAKKSSFANVSSKNAKTNY
jgi:hypothetical protein